MYRVKVTVKIDGVESVVKQLNKCEEAIRTEVKSAIQDSGLSITGTAKRLCPVSQEMNVGGRLRSSIRPVFFNNGFTAEVGTDVEYGPFVEFGTGVRGAGSNHPPLPDNYAHGSRPGMPAQPFLYPAWEQERPNFERNVESKIRRAISSL